LFNLANSIPAGTAISEFGSTSMHFWKAAIASAILFIPQLPNTNLKHTMTSYVKEAIFYLNYYFLWALVFPLNFINAFYWNRSIRMKSLFIIQCTRGFCMIRVPYFVMFVISTPVAW